MFRYAFPLIIFIGLAVFLALGLKNDPKKVPSPFIDKPAPGFSAPSLLDPDKHVSLSDLKGKVTLLNVWASWCAACYEEHPVLNKLAEEKVFGAQMDTLLRMQTCYDAWHIRRREDVFK